MPSADATPTAPAAPAGTGAAKPAEAEEAAVPSGEKTEAGEHRFSPAVRMLAEENNLDLEAIKGTGLGGRVTKKDVESAVAGQSTAPGLQAAAAAGQPAAAPVRLRLRLRQSLPATSGSR